MDGIAYELPTEKLTREKVIYNILSYLEAKKIKWMSGVSVVSNYEIPSGINYIIYEKNVTSLVIKLPASLNYLICPNAGNFVLEIDKLMKSSSSVDEPKFKNGETVEIFTLGYFYSSYGAWITKHSVTDWIRDKRPIAGETAIVVCSGKHLTQPDKMLYAVRQNNHNFVLGEGSLIKTDRIHVYSKVKETKSEGDKMMDFFFNKNKKKVDKEEERKEWGKDGFEFF